MYARVGQFEYESENEAAILKNYRDNVPLTTAQKGFRRIMLLTNGGKAVSITFWESKAACLATEGDQGSVGKSMTAAAHLYKKPPVFSYFDVQVDESSS